MKKKFSKFGSSYGVIISKELIRILGFDVNKEFEMTTKDGKIIIEPINEEEEAQ